MAFTRQAYLFYIMMVEDREGYRTLGDDRSGNEHRGEVATAQGALLALRILQEMCLWCIAGDFRSIRRKHVPRGKPVG